jgi:hypothetical protein
MNRKVASFLILSFLGLVLISYLFFKNQINSKIQLYLSVLGTLFTVLSFFFALLALIWTKENKDILNILLKDYLTLSDSEKNILISFIQIVASENKLDKDDFISKLGDLKHKQYFLNLLITKGWLIEESNFILISNDKKLFVNQIKEN